MGRVDHGAIFRRGAEYVLDEQRTTALAARELRLGAYERISDDQEDEGTGDRGAGVRRQHEALQHLCSMLTSAGPSTWTIHRRYEDNDVSAFKDVVRPRFELLLADLRDGVVEGIVVYDLDRLARRPNDLERVIDIYDEAAKSGRALWFATVHDKIDLSSPDGLTLARVMVAFANKSSRDTARRVAAKHRATALTGRPVGGTRPFGWNWTDGSSALTLADGRMVPAGRRQHVINGFEAEVIRRAAADVLAGVSLGSICRDLTEREIKTTRGNDWRPGPLRLMLESPRLVGYRVHRGTFLPDRQGTGFVLGEWDPVLDEYTWQQVSDQFRRQSAQAARAEANRSYLLSGILRCSECLGPLTGNARKGMGHYYGCKPRNGTGGRAGCGKVSCAGPAVDELVEQMLKKRMVVSTVELGIALWTGEAELTEARRRMTDLVPALAEATGDARRLLNAEFSGLSDDVEKMQVERSRSLLARGQWVRRAAVGPDQFDAMSNDKKRAYVRGELSAIVVRPASVRRNRFDYSRLSMVWREDPADSATA